MPKPGVSRPQQLPSLPRALPANSSWKARGSTPDLLKAEQRAPDLSLVTSGNPDEQWAEAPPSIPIRRPYLLTTGALAAGVVIVGLAVWLAKSPPTDPAPGHEPRGNLMSALPAIEVRAATERAVRGFLEAPDHLARSKWVIGGEAVRERLREHYGRNGASPPRSFGRIVKIAPAAFDGAPMHMVLAVEADHKTTHLLNVFPVGDRMLIDWESSVAYSEIPWRTFLATLPDTPVQMRVYLRRSNYYNRSFSDEQRHDSYELTARGDSELIHAYVARDSPAAAQLAEIVNPGSKQPVNVQAKWELQPEGEPAVVITKLLHNHWVDGERLK